MITIDEAIAKHKKIAEAQRLLYEACILKEQNTHFLRQGEEHEQIAEWLEELKAYRTLDKTNFSDGYNKAIDDFIKEICKMIVKSENNGNYRFYAVEIKQTIADLGEQLKAGAEE